MTIPRSDSQQSLPSLSSISSSSVESQHSVQSSTTRPTHTSPLGHYLSQLMDDKGAVGFEIVRDPDPQLDSTTHAVCTRLPTASNHSLLNDTLHSFAIDTSSADASPATSQKPRARFVDQQGNRSDMLNMPLRKESLSTLDGSQHSLSEESVNSFASESSPDSDTLGGKLSPSSLAQRSADRFASFSPSPATPRIGNHKLKQRLSDANVQTPFAAEQSPLASRSANPNPDAPTMPIRKTSNHQPSRARPLERQSAGLPTMPIRQESNHDAPLTPRAPRTYRENNPSADRSPSLPMRKESTH